MGRNTKTVYISCPITGQDMIRVRAYIGIAKNYIKNCGNIPVSPLEVSNDINAPYSEHMGKDIMALLECDAVLFLRGWSTSKGCSLEFEAAKIYGKEIMFE